MIELPDATTRPRAVLSLASEKGAATIHAASVTIRLPQVGGVSYAYQGGLLIKNGEPQPPRLR